MYNLLGPNGQGVSHMAGNLSVCLSCSLHVDVAGDSYDEDEEEEEEHEEAVGELILDRDQLIQKYHVSCQVIDDSAVMILLSVIKRGIVYDMSLHLLPRFHQCFILLSSRYIVRPCQ